jgi:ribosome-associated heat shock protein Hsp15
MEPTPSIRVDRWLWAVRLYRTRSQASAACQAGHVRVNNLPCKPARAVRAGDVVTARIGELLRTVRVRGVLAQRVGARGVPDFLEDLTPPAEYEKLKQPAGQPPGLRPKGTGRPTKKARRRLGHWLDLQS